jgi:hypothetical protein
MRSSKLVICYIWSIAFYGAKIWRLWNVDQKYIESFEIWCRRSMEKVSWTDRVRNEEVLHRVNEERDILHTITEGSLIGLVISCVGTVFFKTHY